jgi:predicted tellurium resistance membrane protein TerC
MNKSKTATVIKYVFIGILAAVAFGAVLMLLWNWLVPDIFGGPQLTLLQAIGLLVLSKLLFGGLGNRSSSHKKEMWKKHYESKLSKMNSEEREKFKESLKQCFKKGEPTSQEHNS